MRMRVLVSMVALLVIGGQAAAGTGGSTLANGDVLGPSNWEAAKGMLPDEILEHYRRGEYQNRILDLATIDRPLLHNAPDFLEATRVNHGRYALTPGGSIIDTQTGKQPQYIVGLPFDQIDPNDPQAGTKVVWDYFYATWYRGDSRFLTEVTLLGTRGIERRIGTDVRMRMYDGAPEIRGRANPDNLLLQVLAHVVTPADLNGTISLTWRFRDPDKRDVLWTFVPELRRARQLSPLNRSDGFLGSDLSIDDGPYFDGKPEDFTFKLLGRQDMLVLTDPYSMRGDVELVALPQGGVRIVWKDIPHVGVTDPAWKGLPWAPVGAVLMRRSQWIVEAVPRDPNYLYGRIVLRFDAESFRGSWASKYDRAGTLVGSYAVSQGVYFTLDGGKTYVPGGATYAQIAESQIYRRATVVLFPARNPQNPVDYRVPHPQELFNPDALIRFGR